MDIKEFALKYHGIVLQNHQLRWIKFIEESGSRCILLAPRGHGKTTTLNQIWLSWKIANHPDIRALLISHSKEMAENFSRTIRNIMENEDLQQEFNFNLGSPWRANSWRLAESPHSKPTLETKGAMGRMAGWRGDLILFDDLLDTNTTATPEIMRKIENWIKTDVLPALNPSPMQKVVVVGTRKHIDDWYGQLLNNPSYKQRTDRVWDSNKRTLWPNVLDENGNILAPKYTRAYVEAIYDEVGPLIFAQEYMNEPSPPEGLLFKYDWLRFYDHLPNHGHVDYYIGIDPGSESKKKRTSWFATVVVLYDKVYDKIYVVDMFRAKLSNMEQVLKATELVTQYAPTATFVETVFKYTHVFDALHAEFPNVVPVDYIHDILQGVSVKDKMERIKHVCAPWIERGKVIFPKPGNYPPMKTFLDYEYISFPDGDMDMFDALTLAIHRLVGVRKSGQIPFYFPV